MTEYFSQQDHFSLPISIPEYDIEMSEFLICIENVKTDLKNEMLYHMYSNNTCEAEKPYDVFKKAFNRSSDMLQYALKTHADIMETIDSKFTKGLDEAFESLNNVNGQKKQYSTQKLNYMQKGNYGRGSDRTISASLPVKYTLSDLLDPEKSPIQATKDVYDRHLAVVKERIKNKDGFTDEEIKNIEEKSEKELVELFFPTKIDDYQRLKVDNFHEKNKKVLGPIETVVTSVAMVAGAVALTISSGGTSLAVAGTVAATYLATSTAYSGLTGNSLISGTQLTTEERAWAIADTAATLVTFGTSKFLAPLAKIRNSAKLKTVTEASEYSGDAVDTAHLFYDMQTKSEEDAATEIGKFSLMKGGSILKWFGKLNIPTVNSPTVNDIPLNKQNQINLLNTKNTELEYQNYVDRKLKSGSEPLSMSEWLKKHNISKQNFSTYEAFSGNRIEEFKLNFNDVETNITVKTHSVDGKDQKIRLKAIGVDEEGNIRIQDYTTAKNGISKERQEILDNLSKYGGEVVGAGKGKFAGGTEIPKGTRIDVINGSSQFSPEWQTKLSEFPKADLSSAQIKSITAIKPDPENGILRPNPEVYLSKEYLEQHKRLFDDGVAAFVKDNENIIRYNQFGRDDGAFVFPRHVADAMIKEANGDARKLEALLGLDPGSLGDSPKMVVPQEVHNYRIPDGNEEGSRVNPQWRPGGKTYPGGVPEAVIDKVPIDKLDLIEIWENDKGDKNGNNSRK